jgi:hypothetical protein
MNTPIIAHGNYSTLGGQYPRWTWWKTSQTHDGRPVFYGFPPR